MKILSVFCLFGYMVNLIKGDNVRGVNFFGFETETNVVHMLWCQSLEWHIDRIAEIGFNTIRLPVSEDFIMSDWNNLYPSFGSVNPQFPESNMKSIEIMDRLFDLTAAKNINILFDIHRLVDSTQSPKPFIENSIYTFVRFMDAWVKILTRYQDRKNLIAIDVFNEYQSNDWSDWKNLAQITINHIEATFPNRFIYFVEGDQWGGDLSQVGSNPIQLASNVQNRTFYSIHKYWFSDKDKQWNHDALIQSWEYSFGYLRDRVMVGEWGYMSEDSWQSQWARWFTEYLVSKGIKNTYIWSWNYDSGDTKGVLMDNCYQINEDKVSLLHSFWNAS